MNPRPCLGKTSLMAPVELRERKQQLYIFVIIIALHILSVFLFSHNT